MTRKRLRHTSSDAAVKTWNDFQWTKVNTDSENLGDFNDAVFFGLEELDGNAYKLAKNGDTSSKSFTLMAVEPSAMKTNFNVKETSDIDRSITNTAEVSKKKQKKTLKETTEKVPTPDNIQRNSDDKPAGKDSKKKEKKNRDHVSEPKANGAVAKIPPVVSALGALGRANWGSVSLCSILVDSLTNLGFGMPTPIQAAAIPSICMGNSDVIGAAETGSGKTLAFCLPVINALLEAWDEVENRRINLNVNCPFALIIVPTRELALQINTVVKQVCFSFRNTYRIEIVSIVGGMSEHKQKRQLDGRPVHILIATPGRLCELMQDETISAFKDISGMRFLVVDEADRIVEEGHFPELHRVFSRIVDHETKSNDVPNSEIKGALEKDDIYVSFEELDSRVLELDYSLPDFDRMPTEEELEEVRKNSRPVPLDEMEGHLADERLHSKMKSKRTNRNKSNVVKQISVNGRQTLLFSATALKSHKFQESLKSSTKPVKLKGLSSEINNQLPHHIKQLLSMVGVRPGIDVIDITSSDGLRTLSQHGGKEKVKQTAESSLVHVNMPKTLQHFQINVPTEEKDLFAYYYLQKNPNHRTLLFVNSIKTARRVDGFLRALGFNCRTTHSQLDQRQRLRALEAFKESPVGILVATDVAARGLDVERISSVIHYDIARSAQVYIHRSGRTARANQSGTSVSLVSPEDSFHHTTICQAIGLVPSMTQYAVESGAISILRERVTLAKKIFTESFVQSQTRKDDAWFEQQSNASDLLGDEYQISGSRGDTNKAKMSKKQLEKARNNLKKMVETPVELAKDGIGSRKKGFVVINPFSK